MHLELVCLRKAYYCTTRSIQTMDWQIARVRWLHSDVIMTQLIYQCAGSFLSCSSEHGSMHSLSAIVSVSLNYLPGVFWRLYATSQSRSIIWTRAHQGWCQPQCWQVRLRMNSVSASILQMAEDVFDIIDSGHDRLGREPLGWQNFQCATILRRGDNARDYTVLEGTSRTLLPADNAHAPTACLTQNMLEENNIQVLGWPASFPHLPQIEYAGNVLGKRFRKNQLRPSTGMGCHHDPSSLY